MGNTEDFVHIEQMVRRLKEHLTQQDQEIFKLYRQIDFISRKLDKLEKRFLESGPDSPMTEDPDAVSERPPHY